MDRKPLSEADAILSDVEQRICRDCMGVGSMCWCCCEAFEYCECEIDQEPGPCDACDGSGLVGASEGDER